MEWTESVETPGNPQKETNSYPWFLVMRSFSLALAGVLCAFSYVSATQGGLSLDQYNFDKIVDGTRTVLVKFDKPLRGPQDEEYRKLAENIGNRGSGARFLVGEVNIQDHSDRLNDVLRERYQLTLADLPKFLLFKRGRSVMDAARYNGEFNEKAILKWLRSEGLYVGQHGCLEGMEKLALAFRDAAGDTTKRSAILVEAKAAAVTYTESRDKASAEWYIKTMEKIAEQGDGFTAPEIKRLEKLQGAKVSQGRKSELLTRVNILKTFAINDIEDEL